MNKITASKVDVFACRSNKLILVYCLMYNIENQGATMSNKKAKELELIKNHIKNANLSEEEKSNSYKHIEEWYAEDEGFGSLYEMLSEVSPAVKALLGDLGLI